MWKETSIIAGFIASILLFGTVHATNELAVSGCQGAVCEKGDWIARIDENCHFEPEDSNIGLQCTHSSPRIKGTPKIYLCQDGWQVLGENNRLYHCGTPGFDHSKPPGLERGPIKD